MKQGDWEENRANDEGLREARLPFSNWGGHLPIGAAQGKCPSQINPGMGPG